MAKFIISGFYDEVTGNLNEQIKLAKSLGEKYICPRTVNGKNIADYTAEEFREKILPVLEKEDIHFSSIGSPIGKVGIDDEDGFQKQKKKLAELVKICQMTGTKYIRIFSFFYGKKDPESIFDKVVERMKEFVEIVKGSGVKLLHENEKAIYGDVADRVLKLYKAIDDPENFVLCYDASNYIQCDCDPTVAFDMLKDYVVYYHIKDCSEYKVEVPVGTGKGNYPYILSELVKRGYEGFMTLEPHTLKYSLMKAPVYFIPFAPLFMSKYFKAFRLIDKAKNIPYYKTVSTKQVFLWQYNGLVSLLKEAGADIEEKQVAEQDVAVSNDADNAKSTYKF